MKYIISFVLAISWFMVSGQELSPTMTEAKLNVLVTSMEGEPSEGDYITFTGKNTGKSFSGITKEDGKFSILIPKGETYVVKYKTFEGDDSYSDLEIPEFDGYLNFDFTIRYELPKVYTLENVYFDTGKSTLRSASYPALNNMAELLGYKKSMKLEISGHTDDVGEDASNQKLSENRAKSVRSYLIRKGVKPENLTAVGFGESKPIASNDTPEGRQKNRRTEVKILSN